MIVTLLAQDTASLRLQVVGLVIGAIAAVMPIAVAIVVSAFARRQALRDLRNKELVRVHEQVVDAIAMFGAASLRQNLLMEHQIALQAKCAIARMHAGANTGQCLKGIEEWAARVFNLYHAAIAAVSAGSDGRAEQQALLEEAGKMLALVEVLADHVTIQLGPTYDNSESWWERVKIGWMYVFLKGRERMFREWRRDQERTKRRKARQTPGHTPPPSKHAGRE